MPNVGSSASGSSQGLPGSQQGLNLTNVPLGSNTLLSIPGGSNPTGGGVPPSGPPSGGLSSNASLLQLPTIVSTTIPLPGPKSSRAPYFKGRDVEDFIITIEAVGRAAGLSESQLPAVVLRYCSSKVKHTLEHESSFFGSGSSWTDTKYILMYYYEKSDESSTSADSLRRFGQKNRKIGNKRAFESYMQEFSRKRGRLVEKKLIAEGECDKLFYKGLPPALRRRIKPTLATLAEAERKPLSSVNPPPFRRTVDAVRKLFSADDIDYSSDGEVSSSSEDEEKSRRRKRRSDSESSDNKDSDSYGYSSGSDTGRASRRGRSRKDKKKLRSKTGKSLKQQVEEKDSKISQLEERIKNMSVTQEPTTTFASAYGESAGQYISAYGPATPNQQYRQQPFQPQQSQLPKSCFMCGKILGVDLDHPFPVKNCLELPGLINDRILKFHSITGRLVKVADNTELILSHRGPGGMAAALRRELSGQRDPPPHLQASASCLAISLCRNDESVIKGDVHGASSHSFYSFPVTTRSQRANEGEEATSSPTPAPALQRKVQFRDHREPTLHAKSAQPTVHPSAHEDLQFTHAEKQPREYPSAPHKSNMRDGWAEKQRERQSERRNDFRDKEKSLPYRFTSDIQNDISTDDVLRRVLEQKTSISLRELFGVSPDLQKHLGAMVKTRREFNSQLAEADGDELISHVSIEDGETVVEVSSPSDDDPGCAILTWDGDPAKLSNFLERYADAVSLRSPSKFYAKATGVVKGIFGSEEVTFLIDSGSELNLITRRVWEQTTVPIDKDGSRWSLRGLGGAPIPLIGCARDAPIQIEGKNFDHHFFVSSQEHGRYDGILGQPWLHWFSADIRYDRLGPTYLQAFPSGDKAGAFISVAITSIADPRNADKLLLTGEAVHDSADF